MARAVKNRKAAEGEKASDDGIVLKNEKYVMDITGMTHEGQGVGRINNFTIFVDEAVPGEKVKVKIIKVTGGYAVGKLLGILSASPDRVEPLCGAYKKCGGCSLMHMSYEAQLSFKTNTVNEALKRIGKLEDVKVHDTIGMKDPLYYRNKAQFPVGRADGVLSIGFYAKRSHDIIDSDACSIQSAESGKVREIVKSFIGRNKISTYDEASGKGLVRHIMVRTGYRTGEVMVVLVINGDDLPHSRKLADELVSAVPGIRSIMLNINKKKTNVILGTLLKKIYGEDHIIDCVGDYRFKISPLSFFQVNPVQMEVLYGKALEYAGLTGKETVFDLYCGAGTITMFLAGSAARVYGVESVEEAILDARENAKLNGISNVEFIAGEAEKVIPEMYKQGVKADVVVLDPPRKGCDQAVLETLVDMQPERIVYVSCNPATLARDLNYLAENGFRVVEVQPVDMFPQTGHVECVVMMWRVKE